ncbi:hypothetical protein ACFSR6_01115 [Pedobacter vanadiisoli]|uniref:DKNYY family protein n=1 Tax=Pedobacter vanadiisoli TaxID=1761975 RepID=A0ABW5MF39_9SPHI
MQIKYKNSIGSFITDQQVKELNEYNKITYQDNEIKTIESFISSKTKNQTVISYFLDDGEDKQVIVEQNTSVIENKSCLIYLNKESKNGFNLWDIEEYNKEGVLRFKSKEVYDNKHRLIFLGGINPITNSLEDRSIKFYYLNEFEDEYKDRLLRIVYEQNGDVNTIVDINNYFDYYKAPSLAEFLLDTQGQQLFPWDDHPYYHSAYPFLPESPNI